MRAAWLLLVAVAGCSDDAPKNQLHPVDAPVDGPIVPIDQPDAGPCGSGRFVTGEVLDLDSSNASFLGVNNLGIYVQGSTEDDATSPNGRFELCVPSATGSVTFDVVADPNATPRYHDGFLYLDADAIANSIGFRPISLRAFDQERALTLYQERGLTYDPTKAHVIVWTGGDVGPQVTLDRPHDPAQYAYLDGGGVITWDPSYGQYTLIPNVDATSPTGTLTDIEPHTIPLAADKLTLVGISYFLPDL